VTGAAMTLLINKLAPKTSHFPVSGIFIEGLTTLIVSFV